MLTQTFDFFTRRWPSSTVLAQPTVVTDNHCSNGYFLLGHFYFSEFIVSCFTNQNWGGGGLGTHFSDIWSVMSSYILSSSWLKTSISLLTRPWTLNLKPPQNAQISKLHWIRSGCHSVVWHGPRSSSFNSWQQPVVFHACVSCQMVDSW